MGEEIKEKGRGRIIKRRKDKEQEKYEGRNK